MASLDEAVVRDALVAAIPELRSGAWRLRSWEAVAIERPRRKTVVFVRVAYTDRDRRRFARLVAKFYGYDRGAPALAALRRLREAGFRPPARYRVPRPYGYSAARGVLVEAAADGDTWADHLLEPASALADASARAAAWLIRLQRVALRPPRADPGVLAAAAQHQAEAVAALYPAQGARVAALGRHAASLLRAAAGRPVPSHGDFIPKNVVLTRTLTTVVDLDTFALREPAFDAGSAVGHLLVTSWRHTGGFAAGARGGLAFWRRYRRERSATWPRVAAHVCRMLLQGLHYELCTRRSGDLALLRAWSDAIEATLARTDTAPLEELCTRDR